MATNRIRIAKDKADLVKALTASEESETAPFQTYADTMVFAASLGVKKKRRSPLKEFSKREPAPIGLDVFLSRGYDRVLKLIAVTQTQDTHILSPTDPECEAKRVAIFEEFANGGLEVLREELRGAVDYTERLILMAIADRTDASQPSEEFDLTRFLG
ncbi:MAG: DNA phosphorothioation-associated protein 4 [Cyanobacteriota bacterium]|nr:DNA phosphorothioation-associated protein 4 [Cyanobacteriota bacterium]